ncbi:MAG: 50S ribosomal protein L2 [candidate division WS2 bacterium]|uniref:Large ribosomal subunit protein uL2 n=1 Tax=Psychracetigena formicireducens TaxID=2986056 RepID=A0A9E2F5S7_PSYF1|nr:50S ribosomal protein L2 [Candidatus Psychracetigena formicireducens]MBT9144660.1 50S ribosomal protein L2 [Candidatus Psychracetigena formicireducens]MBT9150841.1 50S ribosomal protein L2 [Candidatus Psychracetigena formicireducens]
MAVKTYNPTTPGRRHMTKKDHSFLTDKEPENSLTYFRHRSKGRDNQGTISSRHRGGGAKRLYRKIDFNRKKDGVKAVVNSIEYDPNRSAYLALIQYEDGEKAYILYPEGLTIGSTVESGLKVEAKIGNTAILRNLPQGTFIHNLELTPQRGGVLVRAAGTAAQLLDKEGEYAIIRLPSKEMRKVHLDCRATVGILGNAEHANISLGNAGRSRHLGRRPHVRGKAMNPVDHPHGGGEGKAGIGMASPKSPWGKPTRGYKTRRGKRPSDRFILKRRGK